MSTLHNTNTALIRQLNDCMRVWGLSALLACRMEDAERLGVFVMTIMLAEEY